MQCEKIEKIWWNYFDTLQNSNDLIITDWDNFKTELENAFEDFDKELLLHRCLVQLCQLFSSSKYTRSF